MRLRLIFSICIAIFLMAFCVFYYSSRYKSAFEADQECHYELSTYDTASSNILGCDHDLETKQWILFENQEANNPAKVLKRFRY